MTAPAVYVLDDDEPIRDSLQLYFELMGYTVRTFSSAAEILAAYSIDWTGCLIVDVRLPGMSGLDLIDALHQRGSRIPAIVMTGHTDGGSLRHSSEANIVAILEKPVSPDKLKDIVATLI
ncbi:MAG: response regulator [Planctomycetaceae bacterium]